MIRLECPDCKKDSYSSSVEDFRLCPYCSTFFSGKYGAEKRNEVRILNESPLVLNYHDRNLDASTVDFSRNGIGIKIPGEENLPVGEIINLNIQHSLAKAQVKWIVNKTDPSVTIAGFKIIKGRLSLLRF